MEFESRAWAHGIFYALRRSVFVAAAAPRSEALELDDKVRAPVAQESLNAKMGSTDSNSGND